MATMTYDSLLEDAYNYSERPNDSELLSQLPSLLSLAENRIAADFKTLETEVVVNSSLEVGNPVLEKPSFWRKTVSFNITVPGTGRVEVYKRALEYAQNYWPDRTQTGVPRFYAEYNSKNFLLTPTPDAEYALELIYNARLDPLTPSNQVNWFTENAPQLLLYALMVEVSLYLKNWDKADSWKTQYAEALASLKTEDDQRKVDRNTAIT